MQPSHPTANQHQAVVFLDTMCGDSPVDGDKRAAAATLRSQHRMLGADYDARLLKEMRATPDPVVTSLLLTAGARVGGNTDDRYRTPLHMVASTSGCCKVADLLLTTDPDSVGERDCDHQTPFHVAARGAKLDLLALLADRGSDVQARDGLGRTALHHALSHPNPQAALAAAELLLSRGLRLTDTDVHGRTPMHDAAKSLSADFASVFAPLQEAHAARIDVKDSDGRTPLHVLADGRGSDAATRDTLKSVVGLGEEAALAALRLPDVQGLAVCHLLVQRGKRLSLEAVLDMSQDLAADFLQAQTAGGRTCMHLAAGQAVLLLGLLAQRGADVDARDASGQTPLHVAAGNPAARCAALETLVEAGATVDVYDTRHQHPLHHAARVGCPAKLAFLAERCDPNVRDCDDRTALFPLVQGGWLHAFDTMRQRLPDTCIAETDAQGQTLLHAAARSGSVKAVEALLAAGVPPDTVDAAGDRPSDIAARSNSVEVVAALLGADARPAAETHAGPLHAAAAGGKRNVVEHCIGALVEAGCSIDAADTQGRTAVHLAAMRGKLPVIELLHSHGASLEARDAQGRTPLHAAVAGDVLASVRLLLERAGDGLIDAVDAEGRAPLHYAAERGLLQVVVELLCSGANRALCDRAGRTPLDLAKAHCATTESLIAPSQPPDACAPLAPVASACGAQRVRFEVTPLWARSRPCAAE